MNRSPLARQTCGVVAEDGFCRSAVADCSGRATQADLVELLHEACLSPAGSLNLLLQTLPALFEGHDHGEAEVTEEHTKLAERRVKLGLLLAEIGRKAEVEVTDAEMTQAVMNQARQYPGQERAFFDFVNQNAQMRQQIQAPIFEDKVVDHIFEQATVTEKEVSKEDLEKAVEALDED